LKTSQPSCLLAYYTCFSFKMVFFFFNWQNRSLRFTLQIATVRFTVLSVTNVQKGAKGDSHVQKKGVRRGWRHVHILSGWTIVKLW
jgi:hypothetical protein